MDFDRLMSIIEGITNDETKQDSITGIIVKSYNSEMESLFSSLQTYYIFNSDYDFKFETKKSYRSFTVYKQDRQYNFIVSSLNNLNSLRGRTISNLIITTQPNEEVMKSVVPTVYMRRNSSIYSCFE